MNISAIIDKINIKNLPEMITSYLSGYSIKEFNNLRSFYSRLLEFISEDVKDSYLNRILKYLSSDSSTVINIIEDFNEGIYDDELKDFSKYLAETINKTENYQNLYEKLNREVNFIFYGTSEKYCEVKTYHNNQDYTHFLYSLIKHAFQDYQINLPGIASKRLLNEALTLVYNSVHRKRMIQASAELGNELAVNLYAGHIYYTDRDMFVKVLLQNKNNEYDLWQIAYEIEYNNLSKETIQIIKNELKSILIEDDFINKIKVTELGKRKRYDINLLYAFKIYYYIANKFGFTKAYNSMGKLMIFDYIIYDDDREKTIEISKGYLKKATHMGNINAATNLSMYYYNHQEDKDFDFDFMRKMFEVSSLLGEPDANYYYGKILISEGKFKEGAEKLHYAANLKDGLANLDLGKYYELTNEIDLAIDYYKKAILCNVYDAAYYLAILYLSNSSLNGNVSKNIALDYLKTYRDKFSEDIKVKVEEILKEEK